MEKSNIVILCAAGVVLIGASVPLFLLEAKRMPGVLLVDAGSQDLRIEIDGAVVGTVQHGAQAKFEVKKGKHTVRAVHAETSESEAFEVTAKYYRALYRAADAPPLALVSTAYGKCSSYYNSGHLYRHEGHAIDRPGVLLLPTDKRLLVLPPGLDASVDVPFPETMPLKRSECGWLSTHLCHVDTTGAVGCANADGEHQGGP